MLSKIDIDKELGKGINIYPFNEENIKENSINLSASKYAWSMKRGKCYIDDEGNIHKYNKNNSSREIEIFKGKSSVKEINGEKYIILLPMSTTLVETQEVIAIDNYIGGTYHSRVGIVSLGIGHNGTMFGPNFSGHSLIAIHNVSEYPLKVKVGDNIVSVVFHYLNTPIDFPNATNNGHLDKMSRLGIKLNSTEEQFLDKDWKKKINEVREKMNSSEEFKRYKSKLLKRRIKYLLSYINIKNIIKTIVTLCVFGVLLLVCIRIDKANGNNIWVDRYWNIGFSGILVVILQAIFSSFKGKS